MTFSDDNRIAIVNCDSKHSKVHVEPKATQVGMRFRKPRRKDITCQDHTGGNHSRCPNPNR